MFRFVFQVVVVVMVLVMMLSACTAKSALPVPMKEFSITTLPLPVDWEESEHFPSEQRRQELNADESYGQNWAAMKSEGGSFGFNVYKFKSVVSAREGYRVALDLLRKPGFTLSLPAEYQYTSGFADQYTVFCGSPETTPGTCTAVARYVNYVVIMGLTPGDSVTWEDIPILFGAIDHHVQEVIENADTK